MAKRKSAAKSKTSDAKELRALLDQYEEVFGEVGHFIALIAKQEADIVTAQAAMDTARAEYDRTKDELKEARDARDGTKHALFMYLRPGPTEILPLFDRMEPADEETHGAHSDEWRKEPISALRLSLAATNVLTAAEIMFVGQLQDRMLAKPDDWHTEIDGLTLPMAMAVADQLTAFINDRTNQ